MPAFALNQFKGSLPRAAPHMVQAGAAARAVDCKLWHGTLASFREPQAAGTVPPGTVTARLEDCCWLTYPQCAEIAQGPVACRYVFVTGAHDYPVMANLNENCDIVYERLGVPCAYQAPSIVVGAVDPARSAVRDVEGRAYAYQFTNAKGFRGALSRASDAVLVRDGQTVVVSGWEVPDASWGVTHVRLFRTVSQGGAHQPTLDSAMQNPMDTFWMLVGEVPIAAPSFTDYAYNEDLTTALEEDIVMPPPDGLRGITLIKSMNALCGYIGNRVYFSENNHYHNWPHYLTLDDNVRGIAESNGTIYVGTDGHPYAIPAVADCASAQCRTPIRLPVALPMLGTSNRHIAALPQGAVYASHEGLVGLSENAMPQILTHPLYSPDEWQRIEPRTAIPVAHVGRLYVFAANGAFVMKIGQIEQGWPLDEHSELSDRGVRDAFVSRAGDMYLLKDDATLYRWDRGTGLRRHLWVSGEHVTPVPVNFGAGHARISHGAEKLTIRADGEEVESRTVYSHGTFRLPNWAVGTRWQIALEGTGEVSLVSLASSMRSLAA